jgi:hypothetical protein
MSDVSCLFATEHLRFAALVLSVIFLRKLGEASAVKTEDAPADENDCISEKNQASTVAADNVLSIKTDDAEVVNSPLPKGHSPQKG